MISAKWLTRGPKDGTVAVASHPAPCPSAQPPNGKNDAHRIAPGDRIVFTAGAWRCAPCARRIIGKDAP